MKPTPLLPFQKYPRLVGMWVLLWLITSTQVLAQTLSIEASSNKADIFTGETFTYTLKYSCAAGTGDCPNVTMTASIPSGVFFTFQTVSLTADINTVTFSADRRTATFAFKNPLAAGNTGIIELVGQGDFGRPDGTTATMTASIVSGTGTPTTATVNTTLHSSNKFCPFKEPGVGLVPDNPTNYTIFLQSVGGVNGVSGIGTTSLNSVVMIDSLPANTVINSVSTQPAIGGALPSGTCVIDNTPSAPKVTCTFPATTFNVTTGSAQLVRVFVNVTYPSSSFNVNDFVTNQVYVNYTPEGGTPTVASHNSKVIFQAGTVYANRTTDSCTSVLRVRDRLLAANPQLTVNKSGPNSIKQGQEVAFVLSASNSGNVPLTNVVVEDSLPAELRGVFVDDFSLTNVPTTAVTYFVKTNVQTTYFQVMQSSSSYTPPSGQYITHFRAVISTLNPGGRLEFGNLIVTTAPNITATTTTNCFRPSTSTPNTSLNVSTACKSMTILPADPFSSLLVSKFLSQFSSDISSFAGVPRTRGQTVWSQIQAQNLSGGQPLQNPVVMDLLPIGLSYDGAILFNNGCGYPAADSTQIIPNYNGTGRTLIRLKWNTPLPSNCFIRLSIRTKVNDLGVAGNLFGNNTAIALSDAYSQPPGLKNPAFFTGSSAAKCVRPNEFVLLSQVETVDRFDLDGDGSRIDTLCFNVTYIGLNAVAQLESVKWVKGECDTVYTKHPDFGETMPGGLANYKLIIRNNGNVPANAIEIVDILPYIGDIGVKDTTARLTQWRPNLVTPLSTPAGVTVFYSTVQNPCRTDYVASGPVGCNPPNWTSVLPADPTTVQALKFDFGTKILNPGDEIELNWDMRAPVNAPTNGEITWNSFAFKAKRADNNDPFIPAEPNKVGIRLKPLAQARYGNRVWLDANKNGIQDAGETGVNGVRVELHRDNGDGVADPKNDPLVAFTATANGGLYLFPNLPAGNYFAVFFVPAGYATSPPNVVTPGDSLDSDGIAQICNSNRVTVTALTTLSVNESDLTWDQGIYSEKAALGNYVWFDENQNNIQDESTSNGVNGVIVCLYKDNGDNIAQPDAADGAPIARDTTSNDIFGRPGYYLFDTLAAGKYFIKFKLATGQTFTPNTGTANGNSDETDSDPNATGVTEVIDLSTGEIDLTWDAGIIIPTGPYNLGNFVWNDTNNNGKVDANEVGINGVSVVLFEDRNNNNKPDSDEYVTATVTSTVGGLPGIYNFTKLPTGNYIVQIPDANFLGVLKDFVSSTGNDPAPDPDNNIENDDNGTAVAGCGVISKPITLANNAEPLDNGVTNNSVDFGFYKCNKPNYTVNITQPNCAGGKGSITLGTGTVGDKVTFTTGDASMLATYANATLISSLTGGVIVGNIDIPAADVTYLVRIYNGEDECFNDFTFTIKTLRCCTKPVALATPKVQTICVGGAATAFTATPSTGVEYKWYGPLADTTSSLGTAVSGATSATFIPSGAALTTAGTKYYAVVVNTTGDVNCADTAYVQLIVNAKPVIADGSATICAGESVDLTSKITNYNTYLSPVWTIGTANGTAVATPSSVKPTGTTTYVLVAQNVAGCKDTANVVVTVNAKPNAGKDTTLACVNAATNTLATSYTLVPSPTGGTWSQLGTTPATATISGNNVTGMTVTGTYQFIYTTAAGCKDTVAVTVAPCAGCVKPDAGADAANVCQPTSTAKLTAVTAGGTWAPISSPANPSAATIDASGNISGLNAAGTYRFVYSVMSGGQTCTDTAQVVVLAKPVIADGSATICAGESVDLTSKITNYDTYLSPVWTIGTANGTVVAAPKTVKPTGTTTYVLVAQNAAGCKDTANVVVTVNPKPNAGKDTTLACVNAATNTLATSYTLVPSPTGGTWSQLGTTPATATISGNNVTGMTAVGTYQFIYTTTAGCKDTVAVTVAPCAGCVKPNAGSDAASVCQPTSTAKLMAVTTGGTWAPIGSPANPSAATIDANGNISGLNAAGTYRFVYSVMSGGQTCTDTAQVVVLAKPVIADGSATICAGESVDLTSKITNYDTYLSPVWTIGTANGTVVAAPKTVKPTGTTTYVLVAQNEAGCKDTANVVVTVNAKPNAGKDTTLACVNAATNTLATSITLSPSPTGGTWSQIGTTPATATITGNNVTGMTVAGTYQFIYTSAAGCKDTVAVIVAPCAGCVKPDAGADAANVCQPTSTAKLTAVTAGGTWAPIDSPANPSAATIDANGNISGLNVAGTYKFVYSVTSGGQTCTDTAQVVVNAKPVIADGSATICAGESVDLTTKITNYNTYLSPVWTVGTAGGTAVATPASVKPTGTTTYVLVAQNAAGCKDTANVVVTVNVKPNAGKDTTLACVNAATNTLATSYTLVPSPAGGTWSQLGTTPTTATISGNNVTGMTIAGTYQFIYTSTAGCKDTVAVTVAPCAGCVKPNAGPDTANVCQPIKTAKLTAVTTGGMWAPIGSPANPSAATIDASGNISGLNAVGTYRFVYSIMSGGQTCTDTAQVVVLAKPVIADGSATICAGESVDLTSKITNYNTYLSPVWTIGTANGTAVATPNSVKPTGTTTYVLVAQNAAGCKDTANVVVTVNAKPSAGKDTTLVCSNGNVPSSVQLSGTPTGGTWSALSGNPTGATVSSSGLVSITNATAQGKSFNFVYSVNGCQDTVKVIVPVCQQPCIKSTISSAAPVCSNDAQTYSFTFTIANKLGIVKVNKGTLSGSNPYTVSGIPSGQNVIITDSLSAICKADTTIAGVNCNCNPALPQLLTPSLTACIGDTFPTLKATVVGLATVEWFSQQTGGTVLFTGLNYKPSGTVSANTVFYAQARSTDPTCPTAISTSRVPATINAQSCIDTIDLALKKSINTKIARVGDVLTYTIKVWNEWNKNATGVKVVDSIATTVQFVSGSFVASRGSASISGNVIKWNIGNIAAAGDTVTLRYQVKATQAGIHLNTAEISKTNEKDRDSTPGNGKGGEDDIDQQCFTVPFELCAGQKLEVSVPANLTNVQWFKNGGTTAVATGNAVLFSEVGVYTFTATNQACPANGCCPVIIEAGTNCCPVDLCIPFTVKKVKK